MFKFLRKLKPKQKTVKNSDGVKCKMLEIFDDGKYKYYTHEHVGDMHYSRLLEIEAAHRFNEMNVTKEWLIKWVKTGFHNINNRELAQLSVQFQELKYRLELLGEEETLLNYAALLFYREDEPINEFDTVKMKEKRDYWNRNPQIKGFFLGLLTQVCEKYKDISPADLVNYLTKTAKIKGEMFRIQS